MMHKRRGFGAIRSAYYRSVVFIHSCVAIPRLSHQLIVAPARYAVNKLEVPAYCRNKGKQGESLRYKACL